MSPRAQSSARERLIGAARELFATQGINATGIDQLIEHAGVAKASLYNNFTGKDELVAAYLERELELFSALVHTLGENNSGPQSVLELFALVKGAASKPGFAGCPFSKTAVEVDATSPAGQVIRRFYEELSSFMARGLSCAPSDARVRQLVVLYDGAMTNAKILRDAASVDAAVALVELIARHETPARVVSPR